jgi:hypothetical protein
MSRLVILLGFLKSGYPVLLKLVRLLGRVLGLRPKDNKPATKVPVDPVL